MKEQQKDLMDGEKEGYGKYVMQNNKNNEENEQIQIPQCLFNVSLGFP